MKHIQDMAEYRPTKNAPKTEVAILGHGKDKKSSVLFPDGSIQRVSTARLKILVPQYEFSSFNVPVKKS